MVTIASPTRRQWAESHPEAHEEPRASRMSLRTAGLVSGGVAAALTADAMLHEQSRFDVWAINRVQGIGAAHLGDVLRIVSELTASTGAIIMWALTLLFFVGLRKWLQALATLTLPLGGAINHVIGE